jgi:isopenicillin-N N-acyltransferase-like protein
VALPIVDLRGEPYAQGVQHGQALRERVAHNLVVYDAFFAREGIAAADVRRQAARYLAAVAEQNPAYLAGLRGISDGSGFPLAEIAALNARYELLYYQFGQNAGADGCTAFALTPERTAEGHLLLGQNWDWLPEVAGAVLHSTEPDGLVTLAFTEAGIFGGKVGLNSAGLGLAINGLTTTDDDWDRAGTTFHVRCYAALHARTLDDAIQVVTEGARPCAANFLLAQAPDRLINLEAAPLTVRHVPATGGCLVHANHFLDPNALGVTETASEKYECSCHRQNRLTALLAHQPAIGIADLQRFLRDHDGYPDSVCYHVAPGAAPDERYATVASMIMDLHALTLDIADGPPCEHAFDRISVKRQRGRFGGFDSAVL